MSINTTLAIAAEAVSTATDTVPVPVPTPVAATPASLPVRIGRDDAEYYERRPAARTASMEWKEERPSAEYVYCCRCGDLDEELMQCEECGEWFSEDEGETVNGVGFHCKNCLAAKIEDEEFARCRECGEVFRTDDLRPVYGEGGECLDGGVCRSCAESRYHRCESCDCWITDEGDYAPRWESCYLCHSCAEARVEAENDIWEEWEEGPVHNYRYDPLFKFHSLPGEVTRRYFGFELEVDGALDEYDAKRCSKRVDWLQEEEESWWLTHDTSLHHFGFELASQPMTLAYHKQFDWEEVFDELERGGEKAEKTCGFHVHVSRDSATGRTWKNLEWFFQGNHEFVKAMADRDIDALPWAKIAKRPYAKGGTAYGDHDERYHALNFENKNTVECRIFAASLSRDDAIARMEFLDTLITFISSFDVLGDMFAKMNMKLILASYIAEVFRSDDAELKEYLAARGYGASRRNKKSAGAFPAA